MQPLIKLLFCALVSILLAKPGEARLTRLEVQASTTAFEDLSFGEYGKYKRIKGKYYGELNPADPLNAKIVDIQLAPRNAAGFVEYSADFYLLLPSADVRKMLMVRK